MDSVPGAGPVREEHAWSAANLERYLSSHPDVSTRFAGRPLSVVLQFKGGQSNPTFYLKFASGEEFVLRKKPPGKLLATAVRHLSKIHFLV